MALPVVRSDGGAGVRSPGIWQAPNRDIGCQIVAAPQYPRPMKGTP
jgi:hypothetical protein